MILEIRNQSHRGILSIVPFDQAPYEIQWLTNELNLCYSITATGCLFML